MNSIIRYWNQNRKKIIITILIVAFIIFGIKMLNSIFASMPSEIENEGNINVTEDMSLPEESVITGQKPAEETTNENINIISDFVGYCNERKFTEAYNLLSEDCKKELFQTQDLFVTNYGDIFNNKKTYRLELWFTEGNDYTYRIMYYADDLLSTGNFDEIDNYEDYITIIEENNAKKLNISGFIKSQNINSVSEREGIEITINKRYIYREQEKYNITIRNKTNKTILISDRNNNNICLTDNNQVEYNSILNEITQLDLEVMPNGNKSINIKFQKIYGTEREIQKILFKNIILDKEAYNKDSQDYLKTKIDIEI